jgi:hypothetical protein
LRGDTQYKNLPQGYRSGQRFVDLVIMLVLLCLEGEDRTAGYDPGVMYSTGGSTTLKLLLYIIYRLKKLISFLNEEQNIKCPKSKFYRICLKESFHREKKD